MRGYRALQKLLKRIMVWGKCLYPKAFKLVFIRTCSICEVSGQKLYNWPGSYQYSFLSPASWTYHSLFWRNRVFKLIIDKSCVGSVGNSLLMVLIVDPEASVLRDNIFCFLSCTVIVKGSIWRENEILNSNWLCLTSWLWQIIYCLFHLSLT